MGPIYHSYELRRIITVSITSNDTLLLFVRNSVEYYSRLCHPGCGRGKGSVQFVRAGPPHWRESARSRAAAGRAAHSA